MPQVIIRAYPLRDYTFHGLNKCDWVAFIPPWCETKSRDLDLSKPESWECLSYGRVIMLFACYMAISGDPKASGTLKRCAFLEELWEFQYPSSMGRDALSSCFGNRRLYRTSPTPTYYVINVARIVAPVRVLRDPVFHTIPHGALTSRDTSGRQAMYPHARADSRRNQGDGSELFIVDAWNRSATGARA